MKLIFKTGKKGKMKTSGLTVVIHIQNVPRENVSRQNVPGTKRPKGQNVPGKKRPKGQKVPRGKMRPII